MNDKPLYTPPQSDRYYCTEDDIICMSSDIEDFDYEELTF